MARPAAQNLNRSVGVNSSRQQQAPGLAVQAPLNVAVGGNNLQALAEILGTGANVAVDRARKESAERVEAETEALAKKAEAEFNNGIFDEETYKKSRTYRKTHDTLAGARQGVEGALAVRQNFAEFVKANPYADEAAARETLDWARQSVLYDEEGNLKPEFQNEAVRNIAESAIREEGFRLLASWRPGYTQRVQEKGAAEAVGLFIAAAKQDGTTTVANMNATAQQLSVLGVDPAKRNTEIVQATLALARDLRKPELLDQLPMAWADGSVGPMADPALYSTVTTQKGIIEKQVEAENRDDQWQERYDFTAGIKEKIRGGMRLTEEDRAKAETLGYTPEAVAEWDDQAVRTAAAIAAELEREREKALADEKELAEWRANPYAFATSKSEEILGKEWDKAVASGNRTAMAEILRTGSEYGVLPRSLRNYLDNAPTNFQQFSQWHGQVKMLDQLDDELYSSLEADSRVMYEAYNGLIATARFSPEQAFMRIQTRDPARGTEFVRGQVGSKAVQKIADGGGSLMERKVRERMSAFASLPDVSDEMAVQLTRESLAKDYILDGGRLLPRKYFPNESTINHAKLIYQIEERNAGRIIDMEDIVIALPEGSAQVMFSNRRDPTRVRTVLVDDLVARRRADAQKGRERREAPAKAAREAVAQGLDPWRDIPGERTGDRMARRQRELGILNEDRQKRGLSTIATPQEWQRLFGKKPTQ